MFWQTVLVEIHHGREDIRLHCISSEIEESNECPCSGRFLSYAIWDPSKCNSAAYICMYVCMCVYIDMYICTHTLTHVYGESL